MRTLMPSAMKAHGCAGRGKGGVECGGDGSVDGGGDGAKDRCGGQGKANGRGGDGGRDSTVEGEDVLDVGDGGEGKADGGGNGDGNGDGARGNGAFGGSIGEGKVGVTTMAGGAFKQLRRLELLHFVPWSKQSRCAPGASPVRK